MCFVVFVFAFLSLVYGRQSQAILADFWVLVATTTVIVYRLLDRFVWVPTISISSIVNFTLLLCLAQFVNRFEPAFGVAES
jgi:hypothetical protein